MSLAFIRTMNKTVSIFSHKILLRISQENHEKYRFLFSKRCELNLIDDINLLNSFTFVFANLRFNSTFYWS